MVHDKEKLINDIDGGAYYFARGIGVVSGTTVDKHKQLTVAKVVGNVIDIEKAKKLIDEIKSDTSFSHCKGLIDNKYLKNNLHNKWSTMCIHAVN